MTTAPVTHGQFHQPPPGSGDWSAVTDGAPDTTVPYKFTRRAGSGHPIVFFFYDSRVARGIAFEGLPASSRGLASACACGARGGALVVNVAAGLAPAPTAPPAPEESEPWAFVNG